MPTKKPSPSRAKAPAAGRKPAPAARSSKAKPAAKGKTTRRAPARETAPRKKTPRAAARSPRTPIRQGLSLDRKLDIVGVAMALVGLLTLLSFLSPVNSPITGWWVQGLGRVFGWGVYIFPLVLILGGGWLLLRNFERIPVLAFERLLGFFLFYLTLLGGLHLLEMQLSGQAAGDLAQAGGGGGYLGAGVVSLFNTLLGVAGTIIVLAGVFIISLALLFDVTIMEMGDWIKNRVDALQDWLLDRRDEYRSGHTPAVTHGPGEADYLLPEGGQPLMSDPAGPRPSVAGGPAAAGAVGRGPVTPAPPAPLWQLPQVENLLDSAALVDVDDAINKDRARVIEETLVSFGAPGKVIEINRGPTITQFGVEPDFVESRGGRMRVRVSKITSLADDLALALSARTIRVQAPVPGKGYVGIEVPNEQIALVALRTLMESDAMKRLKSPLRFALGLNVSGNAVAADLASMPHLLIAGATGSGKSVCVNALICCLLLNNTPNDLRLVMVDPKRVELTGYNGIPHLLAPVVVELEKITNVLQWVTREMDMRYRKLAEAGCRNILEFNTKGVQQGHAKLPYLVVIIDELADLMMLAPEDTERSITRLAQLARATGIHLVIATQRPSVDVVTGLIKANFPARIAFAVASGVDSRVILDQPGAERLLGRGDMLFQAPDAPAPARLQGVFVSESEISDLVSFWQAQNGLAQAASPAAGGVIDATPGNLPLKQLPMWDEIQAQEKNGDPLLDEAIDIARRQGRASISMLQRRLRVGYTRAARMIETMEEKGIVGPPEMGSGTRPILDYGSSAPPVDDN